jgi:hypothetical protein
MFQFLVKQSSPALRRMKTLVSARTTNLAAALATQQAWTLVKQNYPSRWREAALEWKKVKDKEDDPMQAKNWQDFKTMAGAPFRGFLTGTTYKSIAYKLLGKGRGEVYLKGRWPDFNVEESQFLMSGTKVMSKIGDISDRDINIALTTAALAGVYTGTGSPEESSSGMTSAEIVMQKQWDRLGFTPAENLPEILYGKIAYNWMLDMMEMTKISTSARVIRGKTVVRGRIGGRLGEDYIDIESGSGMKYQKGGRNFRIPGESYRVKQIGTRRNSMFRGGKTRGFGIPPHSADSMDILFLRSRARGGASAKGIAGPGYMSDVAKVYGTVESFFLNILNKK